MTELIATPWATVILQTARTVEQGDGMIRLQCPSTLINDMAASWANEVAGVDVKQGTNVGKGVHPLWGFYYSLWFTNFEIPVVGTVDFANENRNVDVAEWVMDEEDYLTMTDCYATLYFEDC